MTRKPAGATHRNRSRSPWPASSEPDAAQAAAAEGDGPLFPQGAAHMKNRRPTPKEETISMHLPEPTGSYSTWSTHIHATSAKAHPRRYRRTLRALARTAGFGLVRGIATACGTALVGAVIWWTQHQ